MKTLEPAMFRPAFGKWLTWGFAAVCGIAAVASLSTDGLSSIRTLWPWLILLTGACWALFWRSKVAVDGDGVVLVNVWHTVVVPWTALIGLETKWALTLVTVERRYRAWAAPAPGRSIMRSEHSNTHRLKDAAIGGEIRPGDLPETDSGLAAAMVREHWKAQLESGALEPGAFEFGDMRSSPQISVHWGQMVAAVALSAAALVGLT